jgi:cobalt-precorrin-5B (C1)-methyltransferase
MRRPKIRGDDPDVTNGALVYARVEKLPTESQSTAAKASAALKAGARRPVGSAANNSVPREMITIP